MFWQSIDMKTLAQLLTEQREQKGITQAQLSVLSGIKQSHLNRIECGETKPTMPIVFRLCKVLAVDPLVLADQLAAEFRTHVENAFPTKPILIT